MVQNLAAVRETVQELAAGQNQMAREIDKLESAVVEILMKMPERSPQPPAAPRASPRQWRHHRDQHHRSSNGHLRLILAERTIRQARGVVANEHRRRNA
jgi:hypothetical protein